MNIDKLKQAIEISNLLEEDSCSYSDELNGKIVMSILQRGWIFVGRYKKCGQHITLFPAINYRYQGSGKGFGYTASEGPTKDCKIDKCETAVRYHELTEVAVIECMEKSWAKIL